MIKNILIYPDDKNILTQKSEEITTINEEIKNLAQDLIDTLESTKTGVGISAVQIGVPKRICAIQDNNNQYIIMINPYITKRHGKLFYNEGCLSAPHTTKKVLRNQKVQCTYIDLKGNKKNITRGGLASIIIQHELDHFEGWCEVFDNVKTKGIEEDK